MCIRVGLKLCSCTNIHQRALQSSKPIQSIFWTQKLITFTLWAREMVMSYWKDSNVQNPTSELMLIGYSDTWNQSKSHTGHGNFDPKPRVTLSHESCWPKCQKWLPRLSRMSVVWSGPSWDENNLGCCLRPVDEVSWLMALLYKLAYLSCIAKVGGVRDQS